MASPFDAPNVNWQLLADLPDQWAAGKQWREDRDIQRARKEVFSSVTADPQAAVTQLLSIGDFEGASKAASIAKALRPEGLTPYQSEILDLKRQELGQKQPMAPSVQSFFDENGKERTSQAAYGALTGGGLGIGLPLAAAGLVEAGRPLGRMFRAAIAPGAEAERRVAQSIATDQAAGRPALAEPDMARALQVTGQPVTNIERGGETTRALARSAANQSPQARDTLNQTINNRVEGQGDRITQFTRGLVGGTDATTTREALTEAARRANRPAYARAYQAGDRGIWSPELERLSGSPDVLAAMKAAASTGKSRAVNEGFGAFNPGVTFENNVLRFVPNAKGQRSYPNLQFWDYAKRELDDAANAARRAGRNEEAARLSGQASLLRNELDRMVPTYRGAREGAAAFFGAQDALEAGQNFINRRVDWREAQNAVNRMASAERQLFAEGFTDALIRRVEQAGDRRNVVNQIFGSQDARTRIRIALGPQRSRELESFLRIEAAMDLASEPCRAIRPRRYLAKAPGLATDGLQEEHVMALLQSFSAAA